ncbi:hypothetical protein C8R45DRAFT_938746 [Mycena sanguinolenta]|nr:hypothetical protein C8R45DRAFT_938746 [Mycena sanguinolenta]
MDGSSFTFTCPLPNGNGNHRLPSVTQPLFSMFRLNPPEPLGVRAAAQARYRAHHPDEERAKALFDGNCHRSASEADHIHSHFGTLSGPESDTEFMAGWDRFRLTSGAFDRQDALFILKYSSPAVLTPSAEEVGRLNLDIDWGDCEAVQMYDKIALGTLESLGDDEFEFMFRHAIPVPTFDNTGICGGLTQVFSAAAGIVNS